MGYTRYWRRTDKPLTEEFVEEVKKIIAQAEKKGISICGWDGTSEPKITCDAINFNGKAPYLDHETCCFISGEESGFNFCKTARKPYDYVVKRVLTAAKKHGIVSETNSDGQNEMISDEDYLKEYGL